MCVAKEAGDRLAAFQVGNEADFLWVGDRSSGRNPTTLTSYFREYQEFVDAVRAKTPQAPFAGPDTANNMDWVDRFGQRVGTKP